MPTSWLSLVVASSGVLSGLSPLVPVSPTELPCFGLKQAVESLLDRISDSLPEMAVNLLRID